MKTITLKDKTSEVIIAPSIGGSVLAFNVDIDGVKRSILRDASNAHSVHDSSCFPLVPYSNRIKAGKFDWLGETIQLPLNHRPEKHSIHGHGWQANWQVSGVTDNTAILTYQHDADEWSCAYLAEQTFTLEQGRLTISLSVKNMGNKDMPIGLGLHPYFTRTKLSCLKTDVDKMWAVDDECLPTVIEQAPKSLSSSRGMSINKNILDNALINFKQEAEIIWPEWGVKADVLSSVNCSFLVVYSPKNQDFFCIEPVTHCTDAINMQAQGHNNTGLQWIKPDEIVDIWMEISASTIG